VDSKLKSSRRKNDDEIEIKKKKVIEKESAVKGHNPSP
jgi:hypothetical protein